MLFSRLRQASTLLSSKSNITQKTPSTLDLSQSTTREQPRNLTITTLYLINIAFLSAQPDPETLEITSISKPISTTGSTKTESIMNTKLTLEELKFICSVPSSMLHSQILADFTLLPSLEG